MRFLFAVMLLGALAACGADGEPIRPSLNAGVTVGSSGVHTNVGVGARKGPISIFLGL